MTKARHPMRAVTAGMTLVPNDTLTRPSPWRKPCLTDR